MVLQSYGLMAMRVTYSLACSVLWLKIDKKKRKNIFRRKGLLKFQLEFDYHRCIINVSNQ